MKIFRITSKRGHDFNATYFCENCGTRKSGEGYDDNNFYLNVIPKMKCKLCGYKSEDSSDLKTIAEMTTQITRLVDACKKHDKNDPTAIEASSFLRKALG